MKRNRKTAREVAWVDIDREVHAYDFSEYMTKVAQARYVIRKVQMIIDECARERGLVPLEHQALIQIYGAPERTLPVGQLAERLNIVPALASRLVQQLETAGMVRRVQSKKDRRTILVRATSQGATRLFQIVEKAHEQIEMFRQQATAEERQAAHEIMAFYVGGVGVPRT